jgi:hypothetical protein
MAFDERMAGTTCMTINVSMCIKASNPAVHSSEARINLDLSDRSMGYGSRMR